MIEPGWTCASIDVSPGQPCLHFQRRRRGEPTALTEEFASMFLIGGLSSSNVLPKYATSRLDDLTGRVSICEV